MHYHGNVEVFVALCSLIVLTMTSPLTVTSQVTRSHLSCSQPHLYRWQRPLRFSVSNVTSYYLSGQIIWFTSYLYFNFASYLLFHVFVLLSYVSFIISSHWTLLCGHMYSITYAHITICLPTVFPTVLVLLINAYN